MNRFLVILFCFVTILSCNDEIIVNTKNYKPNLQNNQININFIVNSTIYQFMNKVFFDLQSENELNYTKVTTELISHNPKEYTELIKSLDTLITNSDIDFMLNQIDTNQYYWNAPLLNNTVCLPRAIQDTYFGEYDRDNWDNFRKNYGTGGIHNYSKPIFSLDSTLIIIEHSGFGDWSLGSGERLIYKKQNGNWEILHNLNLWIS